MESILPTLSAVALLAALAAVVVGRRAVRHTSLRAAWWWTAAAVAAWAIVWLLTLAGRPATTAAGLAWYAVGVLLLCPPIAVLGARRPGAQAWTWFVVLPLLAVLSLPAVTVWLLGGSGPAFRLETPWAVGVTLVLVMGTGNYIGTRHSLAALAYAAAVVLLVGPLTDAYAGLFPPPEQAVHWATLSLGLSGGLALPAAFARRPPAAHPLDRLWQDFRNAYGLVWARRVMDRTNEALTARQLPARLEWPGLVATGGSSQSADEPTLSAARQHATQTLRWLLKRFVDAEWIEQRLTGESVNQPLSV